jgi:hypothetical protein
MTSLTLLPPTNFLRSLLSHILWYVREKTVLHKVLSIWVDRTDLNLQSSDNDSQHRTTFRKVAKVARQWIQRKSSINNSNSNLRCTTPPELRRASVLLKASTDVIPSINDTEATSQDLACINSIRVLQKWLELDQMAHEEIISDLTQLGYEKQITFITLKSGVEVIDFLPTLSNIVRIIKFHGSENQQVGKNSFLSTYLSQLMTPGELVKSLKVNLSNSLQYDRGSVYPLLLPPSSSSSTISTENKLTTMSINHQEAIEGASGGAGGGGVPFMPPAPLTSLHSSRTESTETKVQLPSSAQHPESELLPSPPQNSSRHRGHRPTVSHREKRLTNIYTKQYNSAAATSSAAAGTTTGTDDTTSLSSPHYILRDGTSSTKLSTTANGERISIVTPQERLTLSTSTPQKPTMKLGELKPSPPKISLSEGLHSPATPQPQQQRDDDFSPGKGRFVRQSLLRQRSSTSEECHSPPSKNLDKEGGEQREGQGEGGEGEDVTVKKNPQRPSLMGGIQHGGYSQPSPPTKNHNSHTRPHSRGRAIGGGDHGDRKEIRVLDVAAELDELMENEDHRSLTTNTTADIVVTSTSQQQQHEEELEQQRIHHLGTVVNQLLDDEEKLLMELESHHETLGRVAACLPPKKFPSADPLVPNNSPRMKASQHTPTIFPDPVPKVKTSSSSSYATTLAQRKEKDTIILQALATSDSNNFAEIPTPHGKSVGARSQRDSNEENRTYFPGIFSSS